VGISKDENLIFVKKIMGLKDFTLSGRKCGKGIKDCLALSLLIGTPFKIHLCKSAGPKIVK